MAHRVLGPVLELVYPTYCAGCGTQGELLCSGCLQSFTLIDRLATCPVCGRWTGTSLLCGACIDAPSLFRNGYFGFSFEGPLREALHAFKFKKRMAVGRALCHELGPVVRDIAGSFDVIVPLPVTEKRLKDRGFNQSYVIGEEISRMSGKPVDYSTLRKIRETEDQYMLSKEERKKNVRGAFALKGKAAAFRGKRVLLVDDLYTTGNTAQEACKTIGKAKPESISFFALARTP